MTNSNKKYYWLKLKEDFFEEDTIEWLEEQENGKEYCLFYLKLCLKSLKTEGLLIRNVGEMLIPYDAKQLGKITHTDIDTVRVAMDIFTKIGLVQILENGEIFITQLQNMVGSETNKAQLMRNKRSKEKIDTKKFDGGNNVTEVLLPSYSNEENCYTEIEIEKDLEKEIDLEIDIEQQHREKEERNVVVDEIKKAFNSFDDKTIKLVADSFKRKGKDIDYLLEKIDITKKANTNNTAGYLISAITNDYKPSINNAKCFIPRQNRFNAGTNNNFMNYDPLELERMLQENQKDKFR